MLPVGLVSGDDSLSLCITLCIALHGSEEAAAPLSLFLSADEGDGAGARSSHEPPGGRGSLGQLEAAAAGGHVHGARPACSVLAALLALGTLAAVGSAAAGRR